VPAQTRKSGGKVLSSQKQGKNQQPVPNCALRIARTDAGPPRSAPRLAGFYRSMRARPGGTQAITRNRPKLARYRLPSLTHPRPVYVEPCPLNKDETKQTDTKRAPQLKAKRLGFQRPIPHEYPVH